MTSGCASDGSIEGQGFVKCSVVSFESLLVLVLKKPPQGQLKEEKLVLSSVGSEHLEKD